MVLWFVWQNFLASKAKTMSQKSRPTDVEDNPKLPKKVQSEKTETNIAQELGLREQIKNSKKLKRSPPMFHWMTIFCSRLTLSTTSFPMLQRKGRDSQQ